MKKSKCIVDKDYIIGDVDPKIYSSFLEHLGRAIYTGIFEPDHKLADEQGFRKDVIKLVKELNIPLIRYPGGNFVSGYNWQDGIGPKKDRPRKLDYAWHSIETNEIGIDEFADWCKKVNSEIMLAVNLGTGTPQDAGNMVEYCNHPNGTYWSDLRRKNGHENPHNIKYWCLGNEMDGFWQICQLTPEGYGWKARETAKIIKWVDSSVKIIACGSSAAWHPTYSDWDRIVLEHVYEYIDYISLHRYYGNVKDTGDFLASYINMNDFTHAIISIADYVKAKTNSKKTIMLSFDEWNVWHMKNETHNDWEIAPQLLEEKYTFLDALVFGGMLCSLLNNSDRVKIACLAQLVNVIAPIFTKKGGNVIKQTIFYPFQQVSTYGKGNALKTLVECPKYESRLYGNVPILQISATYNIDSGEISFFILNSDQIDDVQLSLDLRSFIGKNIDFIEHLVMNGYDLDAKNTFEEPDKVKPKKQNKIEKNNKNYNIILPKLSWNVIRFKENN